MKIFKLSKETEMKVTLLFHSMDKLDEITESLENIFSDDELAKDILAKLKDTCTQMLYLNEVIHEIEFEKEFLRKSRKSYCLI